MRVGRSVGHASLWRARRLVGVLVGWCWAMAALPVAAQQPVPPREPRFDLTVGASWIGPIVLGSSSADLKRPNGDALTLFDTDNRFEPGVGVDSSFGVRLTRSVGAEVTARWTRTDLQSNITSDFEDVPDLALTTTLVRVSLEGSAIWTVRRGARSSVYIRAGGGWMRELASGATVAEDGVVGNIGAGMKYWWRNPPRPSGHRVGVSFEARTMLRSGGVSFGSRTVRVAPAVSAGLIVGF